VRAPATAAAQFLSFPRKCIATRWQNPPNAQFVGDGVCKLDPFQPPKIELIPDIPVSHEREPRSADASGPDRVDRAGREPAAHRNAL
jgi:hypothetical protein